MSSIANANLHLKFRCLQPTEMPHDLAYTQCSVDERACGYRACPKSMSLRWHHVDIVFSYKVITTSGIRPPSWRFLAKEASGEIGIYSVSQKNPMRLSEFFSFFSQTVTNF